MENRTDIVKDIGETDSREVYLKSASLSSPRCHYRPLLSSVSLHLFLLRCVCNQGGLGSVPNPMHVSCSSPCQQTPPPLLSHPSLSSPPLAGTAGCRLVGRTAGARELCCLHMLVSHLHSHKNTNVLVTCLQRKTFFQVQKNRDRPVEHKATDGEI